MPRCAMIRFARSIAFLAMLLVLPPRAGGASLPYAVRAWTIEEGIPTSTVQDIAQTPDGYLWLTTTGGLARFDGVRFRVFGLAQGLPTNRFQGLAVDRSGVLWISSEDGTLVRWDGRAFTQQPTGTSRAASALLALPDGSVLGAGFKQYWLRAGRQSRVLQDSTTAAVLDADGAAWLTAPRGAPARLEGDRIVAIGPPGRD